MAQKIVGVYKRMPLECSKDGYVISWLAGYKVPSSAFPEEIIEGTCIVDEDNNKRSDVFYSAEYFAGHCIEHQIKINGSSFTWNEYVKFWNEFNNKK